MRAVVQRVTSASVTVDGQIVGQIVGQIGHGFLVFLGVSSEDTPADLDYMVSKVLGLRVFEDNDGKMNRSIADVGGSILAVSQFTLYGDCRKGRRPSFIAAARPDQANELYESFVTKIREAGVHCETGQFQAHMNVELVNDGPVTLLLDSAKAF